MEQQRRRHKRELARFPVWLKKPCEDDAPGRSLQGHVANVSAGGMYLLASVDCELPLGAEVRVLFGTRNDDHGGYDLHEADDGGEVVRVERHSYGVGLAVKFAACKFRTCREMTLTV